MRWRACPNRPETKITLLKIYHSVTKNQEKSGKNPLKSLVKDINDRGTDDMAVVEKRIKAGRTVTVLQGRAGRGGKGRGEKKERTTPAQKEGNLRRATQMLGWLMAEKF